jgi:hypothetical protein
MLWSRSGPLGDAGKLGARLKMFRDEFRALKPEFVLHSWAGPPQLSDIRIRRVLCVDVGCLTRPESTKTRP